ncbi:MAG TPA: histidine kinase [Solirubrobacteraceae bacterium]|nr:histidine kinase [Solirubrobacteraceae bacterium]
MIDAFVNWFRRSWFAYGYEGAGTAPLEAIAWRLFGVVVLGAFIAITFATHPYPGFQGRDIAVLASFIAFVGFAIAAHPERRELPPRQRILALLGVLVASGTLGAFQPHGVWVLGPYYVAIVGALNLDRRPAWLLFLATIAPFLAGYIVKGQIANGGTFLSGILPWFFAMRLLHYVAEQRDELKASKASEAQAAAAAERGRLAREMHDVLAHSLSALALQLETARLLARDRGVDSDVTQAIDRAHHLAASGLDEARRAIAAERGEQLPGPERIGALADAFKEQSGLPVALEVHGEPRELPPEARLAMYRTAQEALTNVRRHATAERVDVRLDYGPNRTVLVVEDHAVPGSPPPAGIGLSGGYGLTGMRERAELLGGELLALPTPTGFRVELSLPTDA